MIKKFLILLLLFGSVFSQTRGKNIDGSEEFIYLNDKIKKLERRIEQLENKNSKPSGQTYQYKSNTIPIRTIEIGMSKTRVKMILGEPDKVNKFGGSVGDYWVYNSVGIISFTFRGKVESVQEF
jgi:hypothetical protein